MRTGLAVSVVGHILFLAWGVFSLASPKPLEMVVEAVPVDLIPVGDITKLDVNFVAVAAQAATHSTIRRAHARGLKVYAWTINDPVQMSVMMSRGVDGIITDRVALARQVQELRATLTPLGRFVIWMAGEAGLLRGKEQPSFREDA